MKELLMFSNNTNITCMTICRKKTFSNKSIEKKSLTFWDGEIRSFLLMYSFRTRNDECLLSETIS